MLKQRANALWCRTQSCFVPCVWFQDLHRNQDVSAPSDSSHCNTSLSPLPKLSVHYNAGLWRLPSHSTQLTQCHGTSFLGQTTHRFTQPTSVSLSGSPTSYSWFKGLLSRLFLGWIHLSCPYLLQLKLHDRNRSQEVSSSRLPMPVQKITSITALEKAKSKNWEFKINYSSYYLGLVFPWRAGSRGCIFQERDWTAIRYIYWSKKSYTMPVPDPILDITNLIFDTELPQCQSCSIQQPQTFLKCCITPDKHNVCLLKFWAGKADLAALQQWKFQGWGRHGMQEAAGPSLLCPSSVHQIATQMAHMLAAEHS